jgi:hypothetical protein
MKIYNYLIGPFKDSDYDKKGKIICLIDTDENRIDVDSVITNKNLYFKRLVFNKKDNTILYDVNSDLTTVTTIEDSLNSIIFVETLKFFSSENQELIPLLEETNINPKSVYSKNALDLKDSEKDILKAFFNKNYGSNKLIFAKKYLELSDDDLIGDEIEWVSEIKRIINN